uniref:Uncharacterized protein n=1 Tax=viral metagenome TaxID=1070528 RepID=A0A6H1ZDB3_9ZZZZ
MYYQINKKDLRKYKGSDFKDGDTIETENYTFSIRYGGYDTPALCTMVRSNKTCKAIDVVFWKDWFSSFLHDWKY